jgi:hypothetical protein
MMQIAPDHPAAVQGRRHSRDVLASAARVVKVAAETRQADAASTLATALQLVLTTALVDGFDAQEVYGALAGAVAFAVMRLPEDQRFGVLTAMTTEVVDRMRLATLN